MNKHQAEKIINAYGSAIANAKNVFKRRSTLPCSKAKIRFAFYVYIPAIIANLGNLPEDIGQTLVATYSMLDCFLPDEDAERLNRTPTLIKDKKLDWENPDDKKQIDEYFSLVTNALHNEIYFDEINDYIDECYKEKGIKKE